jgi:hypothetical protein
MSSASRPTGSAAPRLVAGVVLSILAALNCLFWVTVWGFHCFDGCADTGTWHGDVGAWQWTAMGWLGVASFACSVASAIALARRWFAPAVLCATVLTGVAPWIIDATG